LRSSEQCHLDRGAAVVIIFGKSGGGLIELLSILREVPPGKIIFFRFLFHVQIFISS
jgi:hypothetical protein